MDSKYSMEDFINAICSFCIKKKIDCISFDEVDLLFHVVNNVFEFSLLKNSFSFECSVEELLSFCSSFGEITEQGLVFNHNFDVSFILDKYSNYIDMIDKLFEAKKNLSFLAESVIGTFNFESPDDVYNVGYYNDGKKKHEDFLFTDGDIYSDEKYIDENSGFSIECRNVEIENSTYSVLVTNSSDSSFSVNLRSDFISDGFLVHEVSNILNDRIEHYKCMRNVSPKVYRLIKQ